VLTGLSGRESPIDHRRAFPNILRQYLTDCPYGSMSRFIHSFIYGCVISLLRNNNDISYNEI
jgi:hypothetical protein